MFEDVAPKTITHGNRIHPPKKQHKSGFFTRRNNEVIPFSGIVRNYTFETVLLTAEMLNGELRTTLQLKDLLSKYIFCDFSHYSLQLRSLLRYLPSIAEDLNSNGYVKNVDFAFLSTEELADNALQQIITDQMGDKQVTVIFLSPNAINKPEDGV